MMFINVFRSITFFSLACLPGCWVTFCTPGAWKFWGRNFFIGAALSPFLLVAQFYLCRLMGLSFAHATWVLGILNLLVVFVLVRDWRKIPFCNLRMGSIVGACTILGITFLALQPDFMNRYAVLYSTHAWMHAAPDYLIANGELVVEEPDLAGVPLAYPWAGHVFQALLSYDLNSTPAYSYIWTALLWVVIVYGLAVVLARRLGLSSFTAYFAPAWLFFGVNFARRTILDLAPFRLKWLVGDERYGNWILYFIFPTQMLFALAMFIAMAVILISSSFWAEKGKNLALVTLLLLGIGFVYPILFPAAAALVAGRIGGEMVQAAPDRHGQSNKIRLLLVIAACTTAITVGHLMLITHARTTPAVFLSGFGPPQEFRHSSTPTGKALETLVATSLLLVGMALSVRRVWRENRVAVMVLSTGALASAGLYSLLALPYYQNEYKFVFTEAVSLSMFPAIALDSFLKRIGNRAIFVNVAISLALSVPLFLTIHHKWFWVLPNGPRVHADSFDLQLDGSNRFAGVTDAIRTGTPVQTVVVAEDAGFYFPALTQRELFVASSSPKAYPGVSISDDILLKKVKGYSANLIESRRAIQDKLFHSADPEGIERSLNRIMDIGRPVAIIIDLQLHGDMGQLLAKLGKGKPLYQAHDVAAWLFLPESYGKGLAQSPHHTAQANFPVVQGDAAGSSGHPVSDTTGLKRLH
jgi:hypothetical protein